MALFVDSAELTAKAGAGGNGCVSFHREKFVLNGGPDGGDGGRGGDVVLFADPNLHTLLDFRYKGKYFAEPGGDGKAGRSTGKSGERLIVKVPPGTVVRDKETSKVVADMMEPGSEKILLHGGRGGYGNERFKSSTRQAPNFAKPGGKTEARTFLLELKTLADVGLVGYPSVGKSTLLAAVTAAKPKIAAYHFTTLTPNLGLCRHKGEDFVIADIPGLIEGASEGAGLGHDFLRHIERTRLIVHVVDVSGSEGREPKEDYIRINEELRRFGELAQKPQIVAANKADLGDCEENLESLRAALPEGTKLFLISAATKKGLPELLDAITSALRGLPPVSAFEEEWDEETAAITESGYTVERREGKFFVEGPGVSSLIDSVNFGDEESLNWFHRTLRRMGAIDRLREKGAKEGDTVVIDDMEFDFVE